jgi:phosphoserine phosphatase
VRRADPASKTKVANMMRVIHRDEVEAPFTDWLREAYDYSDGSAARPIVKAAASPAAKRAKPKPKRARPKPKAKSKPAKSKPKPKAQSKPKRNKRAR